MSRGTTSGMLTLRKPSRSLLGRLTAHAVLMATLSTMSPVPVRASGPEAAGPAINGLPLARIAEAAPAPASVASVASVPALAARRIPAGRSSARPPAAPDAAAPVAGGRGAVVPPLPAAPAPVPASLATGLSSLLPLAPAAPSSFSRQHTFPAGWNQVSVPLRPADPAPSAVFSAVPAPLWLYDYVGGQTIGLGEAGFRPVAAGRGNWLLLAGPATVQVSGTPVSTASPFTISLVPGWNAVATPWLTPVEWADARVSVRNGSTTSVLSDAMVSGWIEGELSQPDPASEAFTTILPNASGQLVPWQGYLLFSNVSASLIFSAPPPDTTAPTVAITAPADGSQVTALIEVVGTADDPDLAQWTLEYAQGASGAFLPLASGTTPVANGVLGTFDPTLLLNGLYLLRLTATDASGNSRSASSAVVVRDNQKVGPFTVSFVDMEVPLAGLPIQVTRTYDSRDKAVGDFGFGWRLDFSNVKVETPVAAGLDWQGTSSGGPLPSYCLQPARSHVVSVTLPDGRVHEFDLTVTPQCQALVPIQEATVSYQPRPPTLGTLAPVGGGVVIVAGSWPGAQQLFNASGSDVYDPSTFQLTLPDGRAFLVDRQQGLLSLTDLNGNQLTVGPGGIVHSSGQGIAIARDGAGRVLSITDPAGNAMTYTYDGNGDLVAVTDREGHTTTFTYSASQPHLLEDILDPLGRRPIRNEYYPDGRIRSHTDAFGNTITYAHDVVGREERVTDRNGALRVLNYDQRGNVVRETDPLGNVTERTFDARNNRTSETNPLDQTTTNEYDAQDNVTKVRDPLGNVTEHTYNTRKQVLTTKDPLERVTTNAYDAGGNLTSTTDALGNVTTYTYDSRGNVLSQTVTVDGGTCVTRNEYDAFGNVTKETDALGRVMTYTYDANGNRLTQTRTRTTPSGPETLTTSYAYDKQNRLLRTTDPDGTVARTVYDALGKQVETIDKLGRSTAYEYDVMGRLVKTTFPDGTTEESTYDPDGRRLTSTDRADRVTSFEYDLLGRLVKTTFADGAFTTNEYDVAGRLIGTTDGRGKTTRYEYDAAGRRTKVRDPLANESSFAYDAAGNQVSITDAKGQITRYEYDALNHRTTTIFPDGAFTSTTYDSLGQRRSETDQAGRKTQFAYDCLGRLTTVIDALLQATRYAYDEVGNRISQIDANGHVTAFEYDRLGRQTKRVLPGGALETLSYDAAGNVIGRTDFAGRTTSYAYDLVNRLTGRSYPDTSTTSFTYTATGRRASATDGGGTTDYTYDLRDRLTSLVYPDGRRLDYAYDLKGNRASLTGRIGTGAFTTSYAYDDASRLSTVTDPVGRVYNHGYDRNGNRASLAYPNGTSTTYTYNSLNRLTNLTTTGPFGTVQSYAIALGAAGNRLRIDEAGGVSRAYVYDDLYRLTKETVTAGGAPDYEKVFAYDPVGNRMTQVTTGSGSPGTPTAPGSVTYGYDERDRLLTENATTYAYDANGNLVTKSGEATYVWDFNNWLVRVEKTDGTIVTHAYDADGNRVRTAVTPATGPPTTTDFLVDTSSLSHVVAETDALGNLHAYYVRGHDLLAVLRPAGGGFTSRFYHADGLGSIRRLTDEAGTITDTYTYSAFGELLAHTGTDPQPYAFTGEPYDPNVGFQYHRARWLDPRVGRFLGADSFEGPQSDPMSLHRYLYGAADPVNKVDPTGRFFTLVEVAALMATFLAVFTVVAGPTIRQSRIGNGVFMQAHFAFRVTPFLHNLIRIVPTNQDRWRAEMPTVFKDRDGRGNFFATLGADLVGGWGGLLVSDRNRSPDVNEQKHYSERLGVGGAEDEVIERLFKLDASYCDCLVYDPFPEISDGIIDGYNSNSYVAGMLEAAGVGLAVYARVATFSFPGITKPIPRDSFRR